MGDLPFWLLPILALPLWSIYSVLRLSAVLNLSNLLLCLSILAFRGSSNFYLRLWTNFGFPWSGKEHRFRLRQEGICPEPRFFSFFEPRAYLPISACVNLLIVMMPLGLIDSVLYDIRFESVIIPPYVISLLPLVSTTDFPVLIPILALFTLNGANC